MDSKNIKFYKHNGLYHIKDQYPKDTYIDYEDAYYHYDIDVDEIQLFKQSRNKIFIRYYDVNKKRFVPLQLKIKNFYYEIQDYDNGNNTIYIENSDKGFFEEITKIWNKITRLIDINNAPNFIKNSLDGEKYIVAYVLKNTNFVKSSRLKDNIIFVLHSVVNSNLNASLLELVTYNP